MSFGPISQSVHHQNNFERSNDPPILSGVTYIQPTNAQVVEVTRGLRSLRIYDQLMELVSSSNGIQVFITGSRALRLYMKNDFSAYHDLDILILAEKGHDLSFLADQLNVDGEKRVVRKNGEVVAVKVRYGDIDLTFSYNRYLESYHFGGSSLAYCLKLHQFCFPRVEEEIVAHGQEPGRLKRAERNIGYSYDTVFSMIWKVSTGFYIADQEAERVFKSLTEKFNAADKSSRKQAFYYKFANLISEKFDENQTKEKLVFLTCAYLRLERWKRVLPEYQEEIECLQGALEDLLHPYRNEAYPLNDLVKGGKVDLGRYAVNTILANEEQKRIQLEEWNPLFKLPVDETPRVYTKELGIGFRYREFAFFYPQNESSNAKLKGYLELGRFEYLASQSETLSRLCFSDLGFRTFFIEKIQSAVQDSKHLPESFIALVEIVEGLPVKRAIKQKIWEGYLNQLPAASPNVSKALDKVSGHTARKVVIADGYEGHALKVFKREAKNQKEGALPPDFVFSCLKATQGDRQVFSYLFSYIKRYAFYVGEKELFLILEGVKKEPTLERVVYLLESKIPFSEKEKMLILLIQGEYEDILKALPKKLLLPYPKFKEAVFAIYCSKTTPPYKLGAYLSLLEKCELTQKEQLKIADTVGKSDKETSQKWYLAALKEGGVEKNAFTKKCDRDLILKMEKEGIDIPYFEEVWEKVLDAGQEIFIRNFLLQKPRPLILEIALQNQEILKEHLPQFFEKLSQAYPLTLQEKIGELALSYQALKNLARLIPSHKWSDALIKQMPFDAIEEVDKPEFIKRCIQGMFHPNVVKEHLFAYPLTGDEVVEGMTFAGVEVQECYEELKEVIARSNFSWANGEVIWRSLTEEQRFSETGRQLVAGCPNTEMILGYVRLSRARGSEKKLLSDVKTFRKVWIREKGSAIQILMNGGENPWRKAALWVEEKIEGMSFLSEVYFLAKEAKVAYLPSQDPLYEELLQNRPLNLHQSNPGDFDEAIVKEVVDSLIKNTPAMTPQTLQGLRKFCKTCREKQPELFRQLRVAFNQKVKELPQKRRKTFLLFAFSEALSSTTPPTLEEVKSYRALLTYTEDKSLYGYAQAVLETRLPIDLRRGKPDKYLTPHLKHIGTPPKEMVLFGNGIDNPLAQKDARLAFADDVVGAKGMCVNDKIDFLADLIYENYPFIEFSKRVLQLLPEVNPEKAHWDLLLPLKRRLSDQESKFAPTIDFLTELSEFMLNIDAYLEEKRGECPEKIGFSICFLRLLIYYMLQDEEQWDKKRALLSNQTPTLQKVLAYHFKKTFIEEDPKFIAASKEYDFIDIISSIIYAFPSAGKVFDWIYEEVISTSTAEEQQGSYTGSLKLSFIHHLIRNGDEKTLKERLMRLLPEGPGQLHGDLPVLWSLIKGLGMIRLSRPGINLDKKEKSVRISPEEFERTLQELLAVKPLWKDIFLIKETEMFQQFNRLFHSTTVNEFVSHLPPLFQMRVTPNRSLIEGLEYKLNEFYETVCGKNFELLYPVFDCLKEQMLKPHTNNMGFLFGRLTSFGFRGSPKLAADRKFFSKWLKVGKPIIQPGGVSPEEKNACFEGYGEDVCAKLEIHAESFNFLAAYFAQMGESP